MTSCACGTALPEGSVMVPERVLPATCARNAAGKKIIAINKIAAR
jgi:hypothetical protein